MVSRMPAAGHLQAESSFHRIESRSHLSLLAQVLRAQASPLDQAARAARSNADRCDSLRLRRLLPAQGKGKLTVLGRICGVGEPQLGRKLWEAQSSRL